MGSDKTDAILIQKTIINKNPGYEKEISFTGNTPDSKP
jgi:hypothetical protein